MSAAGAPGEDKKATKKKVVAPPRPAGKKPVPRPSGHKKVKAPPPVPTKDGRRGSGSAPESAPASSEPSTELSEARAAAEAAREELATVKALRAEEASAMQDSAAAAEEERAALAAELAAAQRAAASLVDAAAERERERAAAVTERDVAVVERTVAIAERDAAVVERNAARDELESVAALPPPADTDEEPETFEVPSDGEEDALHSGGGEHAAGVEGSPALDVVGGFLDEFKSASRRGSAEHAPHFGAAHAGIAGAHATSEASGAAGAAGATATATVERDVERNTAAEAVAEAAAAAKERDALSAQLAAARTLATAHAVAIAALERERDHLLCDGRELHSQLEAASGHLDAMSAKVAEADEREASLVEQLAATMAPRVRTPPLDALTPPSEEEETAAVATAAAAEVARATISAVEHAALRIVSDRRALELEEALARISTSKKESEAALDTSLALNAQLKARSQSRAVAAEEARATAERAAESEVRAAHSARDELERRVSEEEAKSELIEEHWARAQRELAEHVARAEEARESHAAELAALEARLAATTADAQRQRARTAEAAAVSAEIGREDSPVVEVYLAAPPPQAAVVALGEGCAAAPLGASAAGADETIAHLTAENREFIYFLPFHHILCVCVCRILLTI